MYRFKCTPLVLLGEQSCTPPEPVCFVEGECRGVLLASIPSTSGSACLQTCVSTEGCLWFTFHSGASQCSLFKSCTSLDETCSECISGESRCSESPSSTSPPPTTPAPRGAISKSNFKSLLQELFLAQPAKISGIKGKHLAVK